MKIENLKIISKIQRDIKVKKDARNNYVKYFYRTLESIIENYKKVIENEIVVLTFNEKIIELSNAILLEVVATLFVNDESINTNAIVEIDYNHKGMSREQIWGTASTYAKKRALTSLLCLDDSDEIDPDSLENLNYIDEIKRIAQEKNIAITNICKAEKIKSLESANEQKLKNILIALKECQ